MRLVRACMLALAFAFTSPPPVAHAGSRLVYVSDRGPAKVIDIADNGDVRLVEQPGRTIIVTGGEAFVVEERLTGRLVTRVADLTAGPARSRPSHIGEAPRITGFVSGETVAVRGREGRALHAAWDGGASAEPVAVISDDPGLAHLARSVGQIIQASMSSDASGILPPEIADFQRIIAGAFRDGMLLQYGDLQLSRIEPLNVASFPLPQEPEASDAVQARLAREMAEQGEVIAPVGIRVSRIAYADHRLWMLSDGELSSLAEGEPRRTRHALGDTVLELCEHSGNLFVVTGRQGEGARWTVRRKAEQDWQTVANIDRAGDRFLGMSCADGQFALLTDRRLVLAQGTAQRALRLSEPTSEPIHYAVLFRAGDRLFVGYQAGEWGGGLRRIDLANGRVQRIERTDPSDLCSGPLNTQCDPIAAIMPLPWQPECVAVAVSSLHLMARGRIASVCPAGIETLYSPSRPPEERLSHRDDGQDAVAFVSMVAKDGRLLAAGQDGLHRIGPGGVASLEAWPQFTEVDGVLVSFAHPDVVLVVSSFYRGAGMSGDPLMVLR